MTIESQFKGVKRFIGLTTSGFPRSLTQLSENTHLLRKGTYHFLIDFDSAALLH